MKKGIKKTLVLLLSLAMVFTMMAMPVYADEEVSESAVITDEAQDESLTEEAVTEEPAAEEPAVEEPYGTPGWHKTDDGKWYFINNDGKMAKEAWKKDSTGWCYLGADGYMVTNDWAKDSKGYCWIGSDGYMLEKTKWFQIDGSWYHITKGYRDQNKWMKDSKGWCYLGEDGKMVTNGWAKDSKGNCWIGDEGYMVEETKWIEVDGQNYYIKSGYMAVNTWLKDSTGWMFLGSDGQPVKNTWKKDSKGWCYLGEDGYMVTNDWAKDSKGYCWIASDGYMPVKTQWLQKDGSWYHITKGYRDENKWMKDSKGWCYLGEDGKMVTNGWAKDSKGNCWIGDEGYMIEKTMLIEYEGETYGIENGYMVVGKTITIDGKEYTFDEEGKLVLIPVTEIEYDGDAVKFVKDDLTSTFGMLTPLTDPAPEFKLSADEKKVIFKFTPKNATVYAGFYLGGDISIPSTWDENSFIAMTDKGTYEFELDASYCGKAWPIAPVKKSDMTATTSAQYYLAIPAADKLEKEPVTEIEYNGDDVKFVKDDLTSTFGMLTPLTDPAPEYKLSADGKKVIFKFTPKNTTVYAGFYLGGDISIPSTWDENSFIAMTDKGTYEFELDASYCGKAWPIAPVKISDMTATTSAQYYLAIPAADKLEKEEVALEDGVYKLSGLSAGPSSMFNHFVNDSQYLIVDGDKATVRFITDGSTASIQKYSKIALGKSSEMVTENYQAELPEGTKIFEGQLQPYDEGTGKAKYLFEVEITKEEAEEFLNNDIEDDIYIIVYNNVGSTADKIPGWYKASNDIYLSLGRFAEKAEAPAEAEAFRFTLQVGQYTEGADFHTASFDGVIYALKDANGNVYDPSYTSTGTITYSNLSAENTYTFTATKEGWTVVKQGEWNTDAHAYEYIFLDTDEINVTITKDDADKNITDSTNPGMVFRMKPVEKNVVDEALEAVPENLNYDIFTEESGDALKAAISAADPSETDKEELNKMADAVLNALYDLVPKDGKYEVTITKYSGTPYYLYEGLGDSDRTMGKAVLVVENGVISADLVLKNQSYGHVYLGTKEEAIEAATAAGDYPEGAIAIDMPTEKITVNGKEYTYSAVTVPVPAFQKEINYSYHSNSKTYNEGWYDHIVMYQADSLVPLGDEPVEPEKTELAITNNTGMFNAVSAYLVTEDGQEYLVMALSGTGYKELFKGTYEQAVANGDGSKNNGNDTWIHGYTNEAGKLEFKIPVNEDESYVPCIAISNSYYEKYLNNQNTLERSFYARQFEIDRLAETLVTGDYEYKVELAVNNNVSMFKPGNKAVLKTVGGPNNNEYGNFITLYMESSSYSNVKAKKYTNRGASFIEDGTVEIPLGEENVFADIPVLVNGEANVLEFQSASNNNYYKRDLTIDLEEGTATFDPHKATIDDLEGLTDEEALAYVEANANVNLMNALIEAIQVQERYDDTDLYCELAKKCWDALGEEDKLEDDGYFSDDTGDASADDPLNTAPDKEKELLVVSFGTSFNDSRVATIGAVEEALAAAYGGEYAVRRAFTAQIIINHVQSRDGEKIDNVTQAMDKAVAAGVKEMVVQPTHLMSGAEYDELKAEIDKYADKIDITYAKPLLNSDADKGAVAKAVVAAAVETADYDSLDAAAADGTAFVFMGHGTSHDANVTYTQMQQKMDALGYANCFIGTVEGIPAETALPEIKKAVEAKGYTKVVLRPLMVVAGDHANNDMAADEEGSWYYAFVNGGEFEVEGQDEPVDIGEGFGAANVSCQITGLGEIAAIQQLYVEHTAAAISGN